MNPIKSPGPDGLQPLFLQNFWKHLDKAICPFIQNYFILGSIPNDINYSYLCLNPKTEIPSCMKEFRPIGLCNSIYKLITKIISNRLKPLLPDHISPLQSSFITNRTIDENVIIIKAIAHMFNKTSKKVKCMALKIDLSKAFDSLECIFIRDILTWFNFTENLTKLIMSCITKSSISVLWNGQISDQLHPSRGIRQGDPLSPYIFVLCLERLSQIIEARVNQKHWKPLRISKEVSNFHLLYADDVFLFGAATTSNIDIMLQTLEEFKTISGLSVNFGKSSLIFPKKWITM